MSVCLATRGKNKQKVSKFVLIFTIFCAMVENILLIIVILAIVSVYGIAIYKVVCYILTERRIRRLEKTVNELPQKLKDLLKRNNDDRGNLQ